MDQGPSAEGEGIAFGALWFIDRFFESTRSSAQCNPNNADAERVRNDSLSLGRGQG